MFLKSIVVLVVGVLEVYCGSCGRCFCENLRLGFHLQGEEVYRQSEIWRQLAMLSSSAMALLRGPSQLSKVGLGLETDPGTIHF